MKSLVILGARQHAKVLVALVEDFHGQELEVAGYLDDDPQLAGTRLLGYPVLGGIGDLERIVREGAVSCGAVGISNRHMGLRAELYSRLKAAGLGVPSLIHGTAHVDRRASLGDGVVLNPGVVVNAYAKVGNNVVVYSNSTIEHETVLGDNVYLGPGVNFTSNARVGENTFIGAGTKIIPDIRIGANVIVGAGSVLTEDVPDGVTVVGAPARIVNKSSASVI